jgi:hypothetical protein
MKKQFSFLIFILLATIGFSQSNNLADCGEIPTLNVGVLKFIKSKINKKVGRGECWDLAAEALEYVDAKWDKEYIFGQEVDPNTDCIFAGDIIQFENVKLKYVKDEVTYHEMMLHHTAIIYQVSGTGKFKLAHQNIRTRNNRVEITDIDLKNISKGELHIYRPE